MSTAAASSIERFSHALSDEVLDPARLKRVRVPRPPPDRPGQPDMRSYRNGPSRRVFISPTSES